MSEEIYVTGLRKFRHKGKVYDINVDKDHNYVAELCTTASSTT